VLAQFGCLALAATLYTYTYSATPGNPEPLKLNLLICIYNETNKHRANEYIYCLKKNLAHPMIKQIHVSYDTSQDKQLKGNLLRWLQRRQIPITYQEKRQTFGDCMRLANELFPDDYVIISNADIYFDKTLSQLKKQYIDGQFLALTRSAESKDKIRPQKNLFSQDTWIFKTPFRNTEHLNLAYVGQWFCETHLCPVVVQNEKLMLYNPCLDIHCMHKHKLRLRHRKTRSNKHLGNEFAPPHCTLNKPIYASKNTLYKLHNTGYKKTKNREKKNQ